MRHHYQPGDPCACGCGREATYGHGGLSRACYLRRWYAAHPGYMREYRRRLHAKWGDKIKVYQRLKQRECRARLRAQEGPKTTSDLGPKAGPGCARGL